MIASPPSGVGPTWADEKTMRFASSQNGALSSPAIVVRRFCELPFGAPMT